MAFERVEDGRGQAWMLDRDWMRGLFGGAAYSHAFNECARLIRTEDHWMQKIGLAEDNAQVDWDADKVDRISARKKAEYKDSFRHLFPSGGQLALQFLARVRAEKVRNTFKRNAQFGSANEINRGNVEWAEAAMGKARTVRDGSVMALGITASVATAGTATFFIGGAMASAGAAGAKYQDTGDARKAMMAGAFEVISLGSGTIIAARHAAVAAKLGPKASKTVVKIGLTFASDLGTETAKGALLEEKATDEALRQAAIKAFIGMGVDAAEATALGAAVKED